MMQFHHSQMQTHSIFIHGYFADTGYILLLNKYKYRYNVINYHIITHRQIHIMWLIRTLINHIMLVKMHYAIMLMKEEH